MSPEETKETEFSVVRRQLMLKMETDFRAVRHEIAYDEMKIDFRVVGPPLCMKWKSISVWSDPALTMKMKIDFRVVMKIDFRVVRPHG